MNRTRALIICTRPSDYVPTRVREAAMHLLAQVDVSEDEKRLADDALKSLHPPAAPAPQGTRSTPRVKATVSERKSR